MNESLFIQFVNKWFKPIITKITETLNDKDEETPVYWHSRMLKKEFSTTLKWGSMTSNGRVVVADVVSMDSSLPLKKRDTIKKAEGDIPKLGMKLYLNERTMTDINILAAQGGRENDIIKKLFADTKKALFGVKEQIEYMFLMALSSGVTVISDANNTGVAIRIDFNHPDTNKFGATEGAWSGTTAKPITDIENVVQAAEAKGHILRYIKMDRKTFNAMRKHSQVRELTAANMGIVTGTNFPAPTLTQLNATLSDNYGVNIEIVERTVIAEKDGAQTTLKPWADNAVVFLTNEEVGTLTYGQLAEETHQVEGVVYEKAEDYILISKYHKNDPLREYTSSQALALPVLQNVDEIYILDSEEGSFDTQVEGGAISYNGTDYTRASVVSAINTANPEAGATEAQTDAYLNILINALDDEQEAVFAANIIAA